MESDSNLTKRIDLERFISVLQSKEELWNPEHKLYSNKFDKQQAWKEIAEMFGCDEIHLKTKWKSLRTMYARELKSCDELGYGGTWRYFKSMSFIGTIKQKTRNIAVNIKRPRRQKKIRRIIDSKYFDEGENSMTEQEEENVKILKIEADEEDESENSENEMTFEEPEIDPVMPPVKRRKIDEENYDFMFLRSLLPFFQNLEPTRKLSLRTKIQEVILSELNKG